jgi:hypothetical protein
MISSEWDILHLGVDHLEDRSGGERGGEVCDGLGGSCMVSVQLTSFCL